MSKYTKCSLVLTIALILIGSTGAATTGPEGVLTATLEVAEGADWVNVHDGLRMRFTLTNHSTEKLSILRWQTPMAGIEHSILVVKRDGEPVPYIGKMVKRAAPAAADYIWIKPGESISVWFDPALSYEMSLTGFYSLHYRADLQLAGTVVEKLALETGLSIESNPVSLWVEGYDELPEFEPEPRHGKSLSYSNCTTSQRNTVATAIANATMITSNALDDLNDSNACYYSTWFGAYTSSRYNTVTAHYASALDAFENRSVVVDCGCTDSAYAYVYKNQPYKIHVCNAFWSAPAIGYDSKAGTLLHEMTHFTVVADTDDHVYGQSGCQSLAISNPSQAIDNADSHEYNAENTYVTPCSGGGGGGGETIELQNGVPITGLSASKGQQLDFTLQVASGASNLVLKTIGSNGDADLYVKFGSEPTTASYNCRGYSGGSNETCTIESPSSGTWYIMVDAYNTFSSLSLEGSYDAGGDQYSGYLSGNGDYDVQPDGTYYQASSGTHNGLLAGPSNADFDLYLYRWNGSGWSQVAKSESGSSSESISYPGSSGYYYWKVLSYDGSGTYVLSLNTP